MSMADHQRIDFAGLASALMDRAESLVAQWYPAGHLHAGRWYVGDFDGGAGKSANINLKTGTWIDNGRPEDKGGDLISLYARKMGLSNSAAALELMADQGWMNHAPRQPAKTRKATGVEWMPLHPVPDDAPPYRQQWTHYARGVPTMHWEYRDRDGALLGVVCRFNTSDGGKDVQPLSYCQGSNGLRAWRYKAFQQPRPLYGLWRLTPSARDRRQLVIVVEGEKKADALYEALGNSTPVLGWPGGCKTVHLADWAPLAEYRVVCWPDADAQRRKDSDALLPAADQPGMQAMVKVQGLLAALGVPARIVDIGQPGERAAGWDAADAVAEGWTADALWAFMRNLLPAPDGAAGPPLKVISGGGGAGDHPGAAQADDDDRWRDGYFRQRGGIRECVPNVMLVLHHHPDWQGVLGFDKFAQRVVKRHPAPYDPPDLVSTEWTDVDDTRTSAWIMHREGFVAHAGMVAEAATEVAHSAAFHPVLDWLGTLQHDGVPRLGDWMIDLLQVRDTPYTRAVSRYFLIGMCMRVLQPGVKFDYCLVLEGPQGRRKSSALRVLGGEWFSDIELDLANKDSMSNIRGKWLHEFGEMGSLARSESNRQKSFLSRQVDEFRPTYGRREIRCPRQSAFAGSTNEWAWNKDPTGGRRFWAVEVGGEIDTDGLAAIRDQLFAEAYAAAKASERYWPDAEQQRTLFDPEQLARESPDAYVELLGSWMASDPIQRPEFTLADACIEGLKLDAKSLTKDIQTRVGIALRKLGCVRVERRLAINRFVYKRPQRNAASSQPETPDDDVQEVPF